MSCSLSDTKEQCAPIGHLPHAQEIKGFCMLHSVQVHTQIAPHFEVLPIAPSVEFRHDF